MSKRVFQRENMIDIFSLLPSSLIKMKCHPLHFGISKNQEQRVSEIPSETYHPHLHLHCHQIQPFFRFPIVNTSRLWNGGSTILGFRINNVDIPNNNRKDNIIFMDRILYWWPRGQHLLNRKLRDWNDSKHIQRHNSHSKLENTRHTYINQRPRQQWHGVSANFCQVKISNFISTHTSKSWSVEIGYTQWQ